MTGRSRVTGSVVTPGAARRWRRGTQKAPRHAAELAHHFFHARSKEKALRYSRAAAEWASGALAYEDVAFHRQRAIDSLDHEDPDFARQHCDLLLSRGRALWRAGDTKEARSTFLEAAAVARELDAGRFASAALGFGHRYYDPGQIDTERIALLEEASDRLGKRDSGSLARVLASLADAKHFQEHPDDLRKTSRDAVQMAERLGDNRALVVALAGLHAASLWTKYLGERLEIGERMLDLVAADGPAEHTAHARHWRLYDLFEVGDMETARREHKAAGRPRRAAPAAPVLPFCRGLGGQNGRRPRGTSTEPRHWQSSRRTSLAAPHMPYADSNYAGQLFGLLRDQGKLDQLPDEVRTYIGDRPRLPVWRAGMLLALTSTPARRTVPERITKSPSLSVISAAYPLTSSGSERCACSPRRADGSVTAAAPRRCTPILQPYAGCNAQIGLAVSVGFVDRFLGRLAALRGFPEEARQRGFPSRPYFPIASASGRSRRSFTSGTSTPRCCWSGTRRTTASEPGCSSSSRGSRRRSWTWPPSPSERRRWLPSTRSHRPDKRATNGRNPGPPSALERSSLGDLFGTGPARDAASHAFTFRDEADNRALVLPADGPRQSPPARAREQERTHLSRELHDCRRCGPGRAHHVRRLAAQTSTAGRHRELLAAVERDLACAAVELRGVIGQLHSPALAELGLARALDRHAERLSAASALRITVHADEACESLRADVLLAVYRIATEAMVNAARHADASNCAVVVRIDGECVRLGVSDDGAGCRQRLSPASARPRCVAAPPSSVGAANGARSRSAAPRSLSAAARARMTTATTTNTVGVVIVDDHPMVLRGVSALVEATPDMHVMATAGTAARGLDACLREHRPDVVVMDLSLPDGDGIAITRRLRESLPEARILVLSMCDDEDALFGALRAGAHGYVLKGAAHDCVVRALRSVAAGDTVFGAGVSGRVLQHFGANAPALPDPLRGLSAREREVLDLLASGLGTKEIGRRRPVSQDRAKPHLQRRRQAPPRRSCPRHRLRTSGRLGGTPRR